MQELRKLTRIEDGRPQIMPDPPVIVPLRDLLGELAGAVNIEKELKDLIGVYRRTLQPDRRVLLSSTSSPTWPARWSAWAAWAPVAGSS